jgi:DNA repair photolyase
MDTNKPYYGEFFVSCVPLEMGGNFCSHNCSYCFANLNNRQRQLDVLKTISLIKSRHDRQALEAQLLRLGYPVLISNKVDPFSKSNYRDMLPIMELLTQEGIGIAIQTRGGYGIDEVLKFLPPSVWYLSITHDQEETRQLIERQAPDIESRFELIKKLKQYGHRVVVGANPLNPDWIRSPEVFFKRLADLGVEGVWTEFLHLSYKQRDAMLPRERTAMGEALIKKSMKRNLSADWEDFGARCDAAISYAGMEIYSIGQARRSDFWRPFRECYERTFPNMQDWVNHCQDQGISRFGIEDWMDFFRGKLPADVDSSQLYHYVEFGAQRQQTRVVIPKVRRYEELLPVCWQNDKFPRANPIRSAGFLYLVREVSPGEFEPILESGMPRFGFVPDETNFKFLVEG